MQKHASTSGRGPAMPIFPPESSTSEGGAETASARLTSAKSMLRDNSLSKELDFAVDLILTARLALKHTPNIDFGDTCSIAEVLGLANEILYDVMPLVEQMEART